MIDIIKRANQFKRKGYLQEAINEYGKIIKYNPYFYTAHYEMGIALAKHGKLDDAIKQLQLAIKINPNSALSHYYLGEFFLTKSDLTGAIESYDRAIKVNPNVYRFYEGLARALAKTGNVKRARDTYQQAVKLKPDLLIRISDINLWVNQSLSQSSQVQYLPLIFGDIESAKTVLGIEKADDWVEIYSRAIESQLIKYIPNTKNNGLPSYDSLVAHYSSDGEKIIISSEGHKEQRVCLIRDESGNGNHLVQSQLNQMPIFQDGLNNRGKLRFDNVRQTLLKSCGNLAINKPQITWFTVFSLGIEYNHDKQLPHGAVFRAEVNNFPGFYGTFIGNDKGLYYLAINCRSENKNFHSIKETKIMTGKIYLLTATWDGIGDRFTLRINGCVVGEINNVVHTEDFNHGLIGIGADTNNNHNFNGDFYELLVYKSVLQLDDIVAVEKHLCQKWGIEHPIFKIDILSSQITENPNFSWHYYYLGEYFAKLGYFGKAIENYNLAFTLNPESSLMRYKYGNFIAEYFNPEDAVEWLESAVNKSANTPVSCYVNLADILEKIGRLDEAIYCYQKILSLNITQNPSLYFKKIDDLKSKKDQSLFLKIKTEIITYSNQMLSAGTSNELKNKIEENIDGRCCHHKVIVLKFIRDFFANRIKRYLEIGVHNGTSMSYVLNSNIPIVAIGVDLFEDTYGYYQQHDHINIKQTKNNIKKNNPYNYQFTLIKGNAWDTNTFDQVEQTLQGEPVELLFIDGDHSYEGVKKDFTIYSPLVTSGGLIVLDDYEPRYPGILKFVAEIDWNQYIVLGIFQENELILQKK
ncbi:CmcI family methyltransferase [Microcoleus sp. B9-D4]|uniref:CmcI family methyltransferase n=1 Tax=Microcoleus sp. B9-D4 TaxID=2818711 RepID=UPI002FD1B703